MSCDRRDFLQLSFGGLLLAGGGIAVFGGCGHSAWPEGMAEIKWDRDACVRCKMIISDRRFAAQARGGAKNEVVKFDDIGCAAYWLRDQGWIQDPATRIWVAASSGRGEPGDWLDARKAFYVGGKSSPMGYGFAAYATAAAGSVDFEAMQRQVLAAAGSHGGGHGSH